MPILTTLGAATLKAYGFGMGSVFPLIISSNQTNLNLRTYLLANGWDGATQPFVIISTGIYISSNSTATPALTISGSFPSGLYLLNNGYIVGMGGAGGKGQDGLNPGGGAPGSPGGVALSISTSALINNANGTIAGGGGGGGGGGATSGANTTVPLQQGWGGGGGGGGQSGTTSSTGGGGGNFNSQNARGTSSGNPGTAFVAGTGGLGSLSPSLLFIGGNGGTGGTWGVNGGTGVTGSNPNGWPVSSGLSGGAAGNSVSGNSFITWIATGTRLGPIT